MRAINACSSSGFLVLGQSHFPCQLGKRGRRFLKREGDGASPKGRLVLKTLYFRPDRMRRPDTRLSSKAMTRNLGWCDAPDDFHYNRPITLPFKPSHEVLWRDDQAYDIVITTNHNERPRKLGAGSAIFFHLTNGASGTAGCIALSAQHMRLILQRCGRNAVLVI
ncbi:MAG: L,D-transpeptidase family protein [Alphaproteobacteria bacterium]|nr:L,D-transpeptidase family protein [Alphaproteobacteria bacterium]